MKDYTYIIDSGHGLNTPGKRSPDGRLIEAENNRRVAERLCAYLYKHNMRRVDMLRGCPVDVSLRDRVRFANWAAARARRKGQTPVFLSLHSNAERGGWGEANGVTALVASNAGHDIAAAVLAEFAEGPFRTVRGIRKARWAYVLRKTTCPAVLLELGFHTNREDVATMLEPGYPAQVAGLIRDGLITWEGGR